MEREFWVAFFRFLKQASEAELEARVAEAFKFLPNLKAREVRADATRLIRLLEEELLARRSLRRARGSN